MKHPNLNVTYRKGRLLAAYYYLPRRDGDRSDRTEQAEGGLLVDFSSDGRPIGIEIPSPSRFDLTILNGLLARLGQETARSEDVAPLATS